MADPKGFLTTPRELPKRRPVELRLKDWREVYEEQPFEELQKQAGRCMDCGIPFCHQGCPLGNLIPEWNDLIWNGERREAIDRLHATNNFPEFTGRLCPAPCETACVVAINADAVAIKQVELRIVEEAWSSGTIVPLPPDRLSGKTVAVLGSGPAGLAAAQQLTRAGHTVAVYERADRVGGLLRYGIPEFKMEKSVLDRRIAQMVGEGTRFRTSVEAGVDITGTQLRARYDAVVVAVGATSWRDLSVPGRSLSGVYQAMEYLPWGNKESLGDLDQEAPITATGKHVVILGGGDTGADCLGTALRQGATSVTQLEIMPRPSDERPSAQPWPTYPMLYRITSAHEEGGERIYSMTTQAFLGNEREELTGIQVAEVQFVDGRFEDIPSTQKIIEADLVLLAMGFTGPERSPLLTQLEVELDERGNLTRDVNFMTTTPGVFVCGDAGRGQSLIVWAIAEGRSAAAGVDAYLMGQARLPVTIPPTARPLTV
jgi:glutamate synthase (NADPH/NADH) small chain